MMFEGGLFTSAATVDACYSLSTMPRCQPNYTDEWIQSQIFTDFSESTYPMNLVASVPITNYNAYGTGDCGMILWDETNGTPYNSTYCGIFNPATSPALPTFGGCGNMDIDEASQTVTCNHARNQTEPETYGSTLLQQTLVFSYTGAPLNGAPSNPTGLFSQGIEVLGGVQASGGVSFQAQ